MRERNAAAGAMLKLNVPEKLFVRNATRGMQSMTHVNATTVEVNDMRTIAAQKTIAITVEVLGTKQMYVPSKDGNPFPHNVPIKL